MRPDGLSLERLAEAETRARLGRRPYCANFVDAALTVFFAFDALPEADTEDPEALRASMRTTTLDGVSGPLEYDANGDRVSNGAAQV